MRESEKENTQTHVNKAWRFAIRHRVASRTAVVEEQGSVLLSALIPGSQSQGPKP